MGMKSVLKKLLLPLTPINRLIPKNRRMVLIYSNLGFRDNAKAVYDFMTEMGYNKKYKIVVGCPDCRFWKKTAPENVKFVGNKRAFLKFLRCGSMLYSFGKFPVRPAPGQTVVNLWHGMPLKTIGALEKGVSFDGKCYFDYTIATSEFYSEIMQRCFKVGPEKVLVTGQPKSDKLFLRDVRAKKLILWLPTYRSSQRLGSVNAEVKTRTGFPFLDTEEQLLELDALLGSLGHKLLIKPHPMQDITRWTRGLKNIMLTSQGALDHQGMDIEDLMKRSRALLTDYSSVCFDYMLLDRPIGFTIGDMDRYGRERGFTVKDPASLMPGDKLGSFEDLKRFITDTAEGKDPFREERRRISKLVNGGQSNCSSKRILDIIGVKL